MSTLIYNGPRNINKSMINYIGKIKEIRVKSGMTQEEVAKVIGVSRPTYASIEAGKQELSLEEAQKFVEHLI